VDACNRIDSDAHDWHRLVDKLAIFIQRCCAFFLFSEKFVFFTDANFFLLGW